MLCDDIDYFERAEFVTTNFNNVLCSKMYQLCLVTASITPQCTLVSVPVSSKTGHLLLGIPRAFAWRYAFNAYYCPEINNPLYNIFLILERLWLCLVGFKHYSLML